MIGIRQIPSLFRLTAITGGSIGLPTWGFADEVPLNESAAPQTHLASDQCSCGLALSEHASVYNEEAFHFLLGVERKRFEHSNRPFVLMLVELERRTGRRARIDAAVGARVFTGLASALRDTDVIGWYREERIAGAVLSQLGDASITEVSRQMAERVTRILRNDLTKGIGRRLKVRLYQPVASTQS
jgi:hypothetical protein